MALPARLRRYGRSTLRRWTALDRNLPLGQHGRFDKRRPSCPRSLRSVPCCELGSSMARCLLRFQRMSSVCCTAAIPRTHLWSLPERLRALTAAATSVAKLTSRDRNGVDIAVGWAYQDFQAAPSVPRHPQPFFERGHAHGQQPWPVAAPIQTAAKRRLQSYDYRRRTGGHGPRPVIRPAGLSWLNDRNATHRRHSRCSRRDPIALADRTSVATVVHGARTARSRRSPTSAAAQIVQGRQSDTKTGIYKLFPNRYDHNMLMNYFQGQ